MESSYKKISFSFLFLLLFSLLLVQCKSKKQKEKKSIDSCLLVDGNLILRLNRGLLSNYFRNIASENKDFSHCGIIYIENNRYWVSHSERDETKNFNGVVKEDLEDFLEHSKAFAIYDIQQKESIRRGIHKSIKQYLDLAIPFDMKFDTKDTTALYCSEFVALCYNENFPANKKISPTGTIPYTGDKFFLLDDLHRGIPSSIFRCNIPP